MRSSNKPIPVRRTLTGFLYSTGKPATLSGKEWRDQPSATISYRSDIGEWWGRDSKTGALLFEVYDDAREELQQ